jgi:hypothetical protein
MAMPPSPHDEHRTRGEVEDSLGAASNHTIIEVRVPAGADDDQIGLKIARKLDNAANRVSGDNVGLEFHLVLLGHVAATLQDLVQVYGLGTCGCLLGEFWRVASLRNRNHMQFGVIVFCDLQG